MLDPAEKPPPDPDSVQTQLDFARQLTAARSRAGLTVRQVARQAGLPVSTIGDYFSGRHLPAPAQPEPLLRILRACGQTDPAVLERWTSALSRARRPAGRRAASETPYRGLARFEVEDAQWFFGREEITGRLVSLASGGAGLAGPADVPLVVVGPSGSGKSSLLRAGLAARLPGPVVIFEPTATPLENLRERLGDPGLPADRTIIIDQFEAVFTSCPDEQERRAFIAELADLARTCPVVLALRADFYERAIRHPELASALQFRQVVLGPMSTEQVIRAVTGPARLARLDVEDGLVRLLLRDLAAPGLRHTAGQERADTIPADGDGRASAANADTSELTFGAWHGAYEPGALPLLSHALLSTWQHSQRGVLTIASYLASGGIQNAVVQTAEGAYGGLPDQERELARQLFLRLVHVTDDAAPVRAVVTLAELHDRWGGPGDEHVLATFVEHRLITVSTYQAQITHDAILTAWPRLRSWIEAGMDDLRARRRITEAARSWDEAGREGAALWRGSQLAIAREWADDAGKRASLTAVARDFVDSAVQAGQAAERAARRSTRRLRRLVAALTALVIAVFGLAAYAFQQRHVASAARDLANSRVVAIEAEQVRGQNPWLAARLSAAAYDIARTPQAVAGMLESTGSPSAAQLADSTGTVQGVSLSPDHKLLAVADADGSLRLWNISSPDHPVRAGGPLLAPSKQPLYSVAFSPDGTLLAAAGASQSITLWDMRSPAHPVRLPTPLTGPRNTVYSLAFSPDGTVLAAGSADDTVRLWNVADPRHPEPEGRPLTGAAGDVESVAFSPDGTLLAAGSLDKTVRLWDIANPARPVPLGKPLTGPANVVTSVTFSPDGHLLAAASRDEKIWLWTVAGTSPARTTARPAGTLDSATSWVNAVAFSPDGSELAAGSSDSSAVVWNVADRTLLARFPHPQPITSLTWDGPRRLAAGAADGVVALWRVPPPILRVGSAANAAAYSADGRVLAVTSQDGLQLWDTTTFQPLAAMATGAAANAVQFAPSGRLLAATYANGTIQMWRATRTLTPVSPIVRASASGQAETVAFSPSGTLLATGGDDGTLRLWSVRNPASPRLLATRQDSGAYVFGVAFSPDGRTIAAASSDGRTRLWNVTDPARPEPIGRPLTGPASYAISAAFSPDGKRLAVGSADKKVWLWDITDLRHPRLEGRPLTGPGGYVYAVAFSPHGHMLAGAVTDGTVWLWNVSGQARPTLLATLTGPTGNLYSIAFSPSGRQVAAASADGTVRLWSTSATTARAAICADGGQSLTRAEWAIYLPGIPYRPPCR